MSDKFNNAWHDKQRNKQRELQNNGQTKPISELPIMGRSGIAYNLQSDFDHQLDYLIEVVEGSLLQMHLTILDIWKSNNDLLKLVEPAAKDNHLKYFTSMFGDTPTKPVTDPARALGAIKSMSFEACLVFLKYIRSVRNLK